ncbi:hypothetical protein BJ878DRAFT_158144 [Calycina marina]|uniref:Uncharacterized protein n=1 Tax=Calycina marina TaxID=1763456 RepID=A0A9P8CD55_9HELO|nr:hypothetical protein BJ878DRAFT_158144 [Calycina marina]
MDVSMQQCALLKTLSREVRDKIWAEIVSPTGFVLLEFNSSSRTIRLGQQLDRGTWCGPVVELFPLYSTCKQIHEEAEKVFYLENVVRIAPRITTARYNSYDLYRLDLLLHIRPTILTGLQHLQLSLNIGHFLSDRDNTALQTICFCKKFKTYFNFWNAAVSFTGLVTLRLALTGIDGEVLTLGDLRHISRVDAGGVSHREILNDRVKKCLNLVYEIGQWKWGGAEKSIILDVTTEDGKPGPEYW